MLVVKMMKAAVIVVMEAAVVMMKYIPTKVVRER
jgi:hypothetical protein